MKIRLTPRLLAYLIKQGYKYCKAKTELLTQQNHSSSVVLTPARRKPVFHKSHQNFDTYYHTIEEPFHMASGKMVDGNVFVKLSEADVKSYKASL